MKSGVKITKVSATGNDFLIVDQRQGAPQILGDRGLWAKRVCDRHESLGADGALFLEPDSLHQADFQWDFYNSDGGNAEMCGNAARAVAWYVYRLETRAEVNFRTRAGLIHAKVLGPGQVEVQMPAVKDMRLDQHHQEIHYAYVLAGVPHAVVSCASIQDRAALKKIALKLKSSPPFQAHGVNVTFTTTLSSTHIQSVTFERGVEDFTLSCGTGAVAAALTLLGGRQGIKIEVEVPGGRLFVVDQNGGPSLIGPAKVVAEMFPMEDPT